MSRTLVLTFMANDRPGLVEKLSEAVTQHGGNWLESRMAHLAEKFAGIARIDLPDEQLTPFSNALKALEAEGFTTSSSVSRNATSALRKWNPMSVKHRWAAAFCSTPRSR